MPTTRERRPEVFLKKYAVRLARLCLIRCRCEKDHPVLTTEVHLVDMARSKLREELLSRSSVDAIARMRCDLEFEIRQLAREHLEGMCTDDVVRAQAMKEVDTADLGTIFLMAS